MHADAATRVGTTVTACCDSVGARAKTLAAKFGAAATDDLDALLARDDVDAVVLGIPNAIHRDFAIRALEAGKDVLLEKPMAMNTAECDEVIAAASATDRILQLGFVCRYAPSVVAAKAYADAGDLGRVYHAKAFVYRRRGIPGLGRWFTTKAMSGGGVLIDLGVHLIDLVMHVTGQRDVTRVSGSCTGTFGSPPKGYVYNEMWAGPPNLDGVFDVDDGVVGLIRFANGMTLDMHITWAANLPDKSLRDGIVFLGDKGGLFLDLWNNTLDIATEQHGRLVDWQPQFPPGDAWEAAWNGEHVAFAHAVKTREQPEASAAHGRAVQAVLDAMYQSSDEGREVGVE